MRRAHSQAQRRDAGLFHGKRQGGQTPQEYQNPGRLKKLPFAGFKLGVPANSGAITFKIHFEPGNLPDEWPEARERKNRKAKAETMAVAAIEATEDAPDTERPEEPKTAEPPAISTPVIDDADETEDAAQGSIEADAADEAEDNEDPTEKGAWDLEQAYNAPDDRRKELVKAIMEITGEPAKYHNAPSFAYQISGYTVDKASTLTGRITRNCWKPRSPQLPSRIKQNVRPSRRALLA